METQNCWIVSYGTLVEVTFGEYPDICDKLTEFVESSLRKKFDHVTFQEDSRDGEGFSVRYKIETDYDLSANKPAIEPISVSGSKYKLDLLEALPCDAVYEIDFTELANKLIECLGRKETPFGAVAYKLMAEAIECHKHELYDASVIMCRTAIDSSLYLALTWSKSDKDVFNGQFIQKDPWNGKSKLKIDWRQLKEEATKQDLFSKSDLDTLNSRVRNLGNFAAHIGERQMKENNEWEKKYGQLLRDALKKSLTGKDVEHSEIPPDPKIFTSKDESTTAIVDTISFICDLTYNY